MHKLDEILQHHGVKGMHWGQHHGGSGSETSFKERGKLGRHLDSLKRERSWNKHVRNVDNMSTKDINKLTKRIKAENTFKGLTKHKMATAKDKEDYRRRHEMTDDELQRKTTRLQAKVSLHEAARGATKEQREVVTKVGQTAATVAVKKLTGQKIGVKDIMDAAQNPTIKTRQNAWDKGHEIADTKVTHPTVKKVIAITKDYKFKQPKGKS